MRKIGLLLTGISLILLAGCTENDDFNGIDNQKQNRKITISASFDEGSTVRSGVVEGNADYASGENFYWNEGDQIHLYFVKVDGEEGYIPSAVFEAENVNGNNADFSGEIPQDLDGTYSIYASKDLEQENSSSIQLQFSLAQEQTQTGKSSNGIVLPMLSSPIHDVQIVNGELTGNRSLNFSLKQLNSLLRLTLENNASQAMTVEQIIIRVEDESGNSVASFANEATVEMGSEEEIRWGNINEVSLLDKLILTIEQENEEAILAEGDKFDAYLSVLPSEGFDENTNFIVEVTLKGDDDKLYLREGKIAITNNGDFAFLSSGLKAGMRYYFITELTDENLTEKQEEISYAVGNYYPNAVAPIGVVFWVDPESDGKSGKIAGLDDTSGITWANGFEIMNTTTGANDKYNGRINMQVIVSQYDISDYPAFEWVHNKNASDVSYEDPDTKGIWYLPAIEEVKELHAVHRDNTAFSEKLSISANYWSSSESLSNTQRAAFVTFSNGNTIENMKVYQMNARAIMAF